MDEQTKTEILDLLKNAHDSYWKGCRRAVNRDIYGTYITMKCAESDFDKAMELIAQCETS